ncbi:MAG: GMC family oxidoreductase [Hyphomonadaceae bacterium]|nr:GMC family oxidoreductase [Hyphomonadaceae bacterium]
MSGLRLEDARGAYDAIVVGSGAGGGTLTLGLARRGARVLLVESGDFLRLQPSDAGEQPGVYMYGLMRPDDEVTCVGGSTKFYGAALYRFRESDFRAVEHEAGVSPAWPFGYEALEPYYAEAERLYRVHGAAGDDASEPFRAGPFPHAPLPHDPLVGAVMARLRAAGARLSDIPRGLDYGSGGACIMCATCDAHFCTRDAKMDAETAAVRPALATGNVDLLTRTDCARVMTSIDGRRAEGVVLVQDGNERTLHAPVIAVCAGQTRTALLLRRSRTDKHADGLGNHAGMLGRGVAGHMTGVFFALVSAAPMGPRHTKSFAMNTYYDGAPGWPHPVGVLQIAGQAPIWNDARRVLRPIVKAIAERSLMCFHMTEALPSRDSGFVFEGDRIVAEAPPRFCGGSYKRIRELAMKAFGRAGYPVIPALRKPQLWHKTGGAIMGNDPAQSVTDGHGQIHGVEGLYVIDASSLPSAGAVNTGLTIMALALRAADTIAASGRAPA